MAAKVSPVRRRLEALQRQVTKATYKISELREVCPHDDLTYKYCGDTGNYDKSQDCYWIEWHCHDCSKRWTTTQDNSYELTTKVWPKARRIR